MSSCPESFVQSHTEGVTVSLSFLTSPLGGAELAEQGTEVQISHGGEALFREGA